MNITLRLDLITRTRWIAIDGTHSLPIKAYKTLAGLKKAVMRSYPHATITVEEI